MKCTWPVKLVLQIPQRTGQLIFLDLEVECGKRTWITVWGVWLPESDYFLFPNYIFSPFTCGSRFDLKRHPQKYSPIRNPNWILCLAFMPFLCCKWNSWSPCFAKIWKQLVREERRPFPSAPSCPPGTSFVQTRLIWRLAFLFKHKN